MSKYAVVLTGSKQYRVEPNSLIEVEKIELPQERREVILDKVLLVRDGEKVQVGTPWVEGAQVVCLHEGDFRSKKVISFKFKRRKATKRKVGHRQSLTRLRVKEIVTS